jgi:hypothetical protein
MGSTTQIYKTNRKYVKYNLRFYLSLVLRKTSPSAEPPSTVFSCWTLVSYTLWTKLMHLSNWYARQYSTTSNKVNTVRKQTLFLKWQCSVMKRKQAYFKFPVNEVTENHKNTTYVPWLFLQYDKFTMNGKKMVRPAQIPLIMYGWI